MQYRRLGDSGLRVSALCLGAMTFGERTGPAAAGRILGAAREAGVNFIDTADSYGTRFGDSERMVGRLLRRGRDAWVLATKVGNVADRSDPNSGGLSRRWLLAAADASLARLGTGHIDLYYWHREDPGTPLEESLCAMDELVRSGKVRYWGISNFPVWRVAEAVSECRRLGLVAPIAVQPYYNAMNRQAEVDMLPACAHFGLGVVPYSPLARGVLTGKYLPGRSPPPDSRAGRRNRRMMETEYRDESLRAAQRIKRHAEKKGVTAGQFALAWVLNNARVTAVLAGPRTEPQWREYLGALEVSLDAADEAFMDALVPPGHPSTPGYTDPKFPVTGRVPRA